MNYGKIIKNGIFNENPVFVQLVALCPLLAVTTSVVNSIAMGLATTVIMVCACVVISIVRRFIPNEIRISASVVIVSGFVTILQLLMDAYTPPSINDSLGIFIPLIVVNCILFARLEAFASKNGPFASAVDAFGMGLGFTFGLSVIGAIREFFGNGTILGIELLKDSTSHVLIMIMAPGAFFTLGGILMALKYLKQSRGVI